MDVTHILSLGCLLFVCVTTDTYSGFIYASAGSSEATKHVIAHCLATFTIMRKPHQIKTDNGPGDTSAAFHTFCQSCQILCSTGISYDPQGQAIVERAHCTLKLQLEKQKGEILSLLPPC
jgi:transposase InsO family protein